MIKSTIQDQMKDAMRARDSVKLETLRFVLSGMKYEEIEKHRELTDEEAIDVLSREVKKRREAIELFRTSGRDQMVADEESKLAVIMTLLPTQFSKEEVEKIVEAAIAKVGKENFGAIMKEVTPQTKGKADGKMVSDVVKAKLL
ncbi:MAG TPA: GatB/YqeY domain-containing protein [Patescibacteria group bacterium]|nr:GatB/YqeY domain-containing protein [Patescibacteria group bacterium]